MGVWYGRNVVWGTLTSLLQVRTVADNDKLAQATWSRLDEVSRGSPKLIFHEWSPRRPAVLFERVSVSLRRRGSRLSEIAQGLLFSSSSSRLGEGELAWARVILAWARPSSLSKELGEDTSRDVVSFMLRCLNCAIWVIVWWLIENEYACLGRDYMWGIVSLAWFFLYELYMRSWIHMYVRVVTNLAWATMDLDGW